MTITVSAFYKFVAIDDPAALKAKLTELCARLGIKGSILIAPEGINSTLSGTDAAVTELLATLRADARFADLVSKESYTDDYPFKRMKVRLKREIVTLGAPEADPTKGTGHYVKPEDWNALISDPDVIVVDTRNSYEYDIGTFAGARDPKTRTFREFPSYVDSALAGDKDRRIAMFCTGGIRCEKATAYLLQHGFRDVHHLEGGILKYLETVPAEDSLWRGECFVFDERVALEHGVRPGHHRMCKACGHAVPVAPPGQQQRCAHCNTVLAAG